MFSSHFKGSFKRHFGALDSAGVQSSEGSHSVFLEIEKHSVVLLPRHSLC